MSPAELAALADRVEADAFRDLMAAAPAPLARAMGLEVIEAGGATLLLGPAVGPPTFQRAIGLGLTAPADDAAIDAVLDALRPGGRGWVHVGPYAEPADLEARLLARGLTIARRASWAKMLRGPGEVDPGRCALPIEEALPGEGAAVAGVINPAHGMPAAADPWTGALVGRPGWRVFVARDGAAIVGAGALWQDGERAWLGLGATHPDWRRQGVQRAVMAARVRAALDAGARWVVTETGEPVDGEPNPSLTNMLRCGFSCVASRRNLAWSA